MVKRIMGALFVAALAVTAVSTVAYAATATQDVSVTVTPGGVTAGISASPSSYDFGTVNLSKSSNSATAVTLTNDGAANSVIDKQVESMTNWSLATSTGAQDAAMFGSVAQDTTRVTLDEHWTFGNYETSYSSFAAVGTYNALKDTTGSQVSLAPAATKDVWFKIVVPSAIGVTAQETINVRYQATTQ
jgi:hypothetical protein